MRAGQMGQTDSVDPLERPGRSAESEEIGRHLARQARAAHHVGQPGIEPASTRSPQAGSGHARGARPNRGAVAGMSGLGSDGCLQPRGEGLPGADGEGQLGAVGVVAVADRHGRDERADFDAGSAVVAAVAARAAWPGGSFA